MSIIKTELVENSYKLLERYFQAWKEFIEVDEISGPEDATDAYYFHSYFSQSQNKSFKNRLYSTDWFDVNYFKLNLHFEIASFNAQSLDKELINKQAKDGTNMTEVQ